MKTSTITALLLAASAAAAGAGEVEPTAVSFDGGSIAESLTGVAGDPARGREVVSSRGGGNCVACHASSDLADVPFQGEIGPMLDGAGDRWSEAELRGIVSNAKMMFPDTIMPAFYKTDGFNRPGDAFTGKAAEGPLAPLLTAQQVEDVVAYLATLKE